MEHAGYSRSEGWRIAGGLVGDDPARRRPAGSDRTLEEPARRNRVARRRYASIDDLTTPIDGSIDVVPTAADPSVGLVHSPVRTYRLAVLAGDLAEEWQEPLHPAIDGALINQDAALGQPFTDFCVTEAVAYIPADGERDDVVGERATRER